MAKPSHSTPAYVTQSVRKFLRNAGLPVHVVKGKYYAFGGNGQHADEGYSVSVVGYSNQVSVSYEEAFGKGRGKGLPRGVRAEKGREIVAMLRERGYDIDDRGYITCERNHG